jgi:hypothetical protein
MAYIYNMEMCLFSRGCVSLHSWLFKEEKIHWNCVRSRYCAVCQKFVFKPVSAYHVMCMYAYMPFMIVLWATELVYFMNKKTFDIIFLFFCVFRMYVYRSLMLLALLFGFAIFIYFAGFLRVFIFWRDWKHIYIPASQWHKYIHHS